MTQRVQKILAQWGIASRRQAEQLILAQRVRLNGSVVQLGQKADPSTDYIEVDGKPLKPVNRPQLVYFLLHKPAGVLSTCRDPHNRPTVLDLLPTHLRQGQGIHPVGRLDQESTGALLLTNDGELTQILTHPRYHLPKTYRVLVSDRLTSSALKSWRKGIVLDGKKTLPAQVKVLQQRHEKTLLQIILTEGRNRQIRRVAQQFGVEVLELHRTAIGRIKLHSAGESALRCGNYRDLTHSEVEYLKKRVEAQKGSSLPQEYLV